MVIENAYALEEIKLGRRGENQARKVVFDVLGKWREGYGEGVTSLIVQRNGDAQPYPVTLTEEDGALVWLVSSADTAVAGEGAAELRYTVGDTIVKSQIYKTRVRETLEDSGETPPPAYQSWVDEVLQAAAEVQGTKEYADNAKVSADAAAESAAKAASTADGINDKVAAADASAKAAASSAAAAAESVTGIDEKVQAAQTAADNAAKSETAAKNAQTAATNAQSAAETAKDGAQSAKTAAESAQEAAESAKDAAADSSTAAGQKATQAAQSAEDAASAKSAAETAKTDAQAARDAIVNMIVDAVTVETGKPATVEKSLVDNVYKLVFGLPRGKTGAPGPRGATGNGISDIALKSGNHAPGTSDVYTITLTDGTTFDFSVYNGANGQGAGDMLASVYDPQGKHQDIFKYVDDAIGEIPTPDVSAQIKAHNESEAAHPYIRGLIPTKTSQLDNDSGYLTQHQDISGKLDKPANDVSATAGQVMTKTADGQEWADAAGGVFWATYNETTLDEIKEAYNAGKQVFVKDGTIIAALTRLGTNAQFVSANAGYQYAYMRTSSIWAKEQKFISLFPENYDTWTSSLIKNDGNGKGGLVAAVPGSDYIASGNITKQTLVNTETTPTENYAINWVYG